MKRFMKNLIGSLAALILTGGVALSQNAPVAEAEELYSPYKDPVFYGLSVLVVVLLVFILQLQRVFASVAKTYSGELKRKTNVSQLGILLVTTATGTQAEVATAENGLLEFIQHGFGTNAINALFFIILVEIAVVLYYVRMIRILTGKAQEEFSPATATAATPAKPSFWERFNQSVAVEKETAIMTDHEYDGIRELDNALPSWWKYGFYLTIVWGIAYLIHFHVTGTGPSSQEEYVAQVVQAEEEIAAHVAKMGNQVDETNVTLLTDQGALASGSELFISLCAACHGKAGEGLVGPNLTDAYWKHGGDIKDLFKTVKYGVSGTGMKSWKSDLSPAQMAQVSSYILTLQGSNPPNAKAPEGALYEAAATDITASPDSTAGNEVVQSDTTHTAER